MLPRHPEAMAASRPVLLPLLLAACALFASCCFCGGAAPVTGAALRGNTARMAVPEATLLALALMLALGAAGASTDGSLESWDAGAGAGASHSRQAAVDVDAFSTVRFMGGLPVFTQNQTRVGAGARAGTSSAVGRCWLLAAVCRMPAMLLPWRPSDVCATRTAAAEAMALESSLTTALAVSTPGWWANIVGIMVPLTFLIVLYLQPAPRRGRGRGARHASLRHACGREAKSKPRVQGSHAHGQMLGGVTKPMVRLLSGRGGGNWCFLRL